MVKDSGMSSSSVPASLAKGHSDQDQDKDQDQDDGMPCTVLHPSVRRVVIPLDDAALPEQGRNVGVALAQLFDAMVLLIRCYSERTYLPSGNAAFGADGAEANRRLGPVNGGTSSQHPLHAALAYLEQVEAEMTRAGLIVHTEAVQWPPSLAIVRFANRPLADLVVMVTHLGESGSPKPIAGSISREVIEHITPGVPVLLLPVRWMANWQGMQRLGVKGSRTMVIALVRQNGDSGASDPESPALTQSYAELVARLFSGAITSVSMPPDAASLDIGEPAVKSTGQDTGCRRISMFILGGSQRATLARDAQRLLYAAQIPVLVVPEVS